MAILSLKDILEATGGRLLSGDSGTFRGVSIDSRTISEGEVFFAIRGERFDGHDFVAKALMKGSAAVVDSGQGEFPKGKVIIRVGDTLRSLQDLAHFIRMKRDIPVVAVTGSGGKTTTKEMIHAILSGRFKALKNEGNLNNHIGLPLSLVKLEADDEAAVLEMGMNARGEIRRLCEIAAPDYGVITNIGFAHIGRLGSRKAVRDAKFEILRGLDLAVVNADDAYLAEGLKAVEDFNGRIITFGIESDAHVTAKDVRVAESGCAFKLEAGDKGSADVALRVHGLFNVYNSLAASAVCLSLGIGIDEIKSALESFRAFPMRFELIRGDNITLINDSYNANPSSMEESLKEALRLAGRGRAVAVLGDMGELDEYTENGHRAVGRLVSEMDVDVFVAVGEKMRLAAEEIKEAKGENPLPEVFVFKNADAAGKDIVDILKQGDTVLIKGSRMMSMEKIVRSIKNVI